MALSYTETLLQQLGINLVPSAEIFAQMQQAGMVQANELYFIGGLSGSAAFPETVCLIKGNGLGGASAAVPGTDYALPTITDAGGYFTAGTIEGALQEIGAELSGINTLLGNGVIA